MRQFYYERLPMALQSIYQRIFSALEALERSVVVSYPGAAQLKEVVKYVQMDHPEFFWLNGKWHYTVQKIGMAEMVEIKFFCFQDMDSTFQITRARKKLNAAVNRILKSIPENVDLFKKVLQVHDWIVDNTVYKMGGRHCYDAYGCLVLGKSVCAGYANGFQLLMNRLAISCAYVSGVTTQGSESHAWNCLELNGEFYYMDVTWDDPINRDKTQMNTCSHEYFCVTLEQISKDHTAFADNFAPNAEALDFDFFRHEGYYMVQYSFDLLYFMVKANLKRKSTFEICFSSFEERDRAEEDVWKHPEFRKIAGAHRSPELTLRRTRPILSIRFI